MMTITGPVQLAFPVWGLHSGWQATHSPLSPANSLGILGTKYAYLSKTNTTHFQCMQTYWPRVKMTACDTRAMATVVPTGETLIRPRAPTARVRTQRVTHVAVCNWTPNNTMKNHSNTQIGWSFCQSLIYYAHHILPLACCCWGCWPGLCCPWTAASSSPCGGSTGGRSDWCTRCHRWSPAGSADPVRSEWGCASPWGKIAFKGNRKTC